MRKKTITTIATFTIATLIAVTLLLTVASHSVDAQFSGISALNDDKESVRLLAHKPSPVATTKDGGIIRTSQNLPEQDCSGGIPVCQSSYTQTQSYTGAGAVQEAAGTCLGIGESNSVWYIFTAQTTGSLTFTINTQKDYDFALYNISNGGCANLGAPIRCNFSDDFGQTGLELPAASESPISYNASDPAMMPGVNVTAGQTYALLVNNWTADANGYTLTFGGDASIFDATPPKLQSVSLDLAQCAIEITVSEPIRCSSIATDGSDFLLTTPGGAVVTGASGVNCGTFTNKIRLNYALGNTDACGTWTITAKTGTDGNTLVDNCNNSLASGGTLTLATPPSAVPQLTLPGNVFCEGTPIIADGSGSTGETKHFWSVVESDSNWNVIGQECSGWFAGSAGTLDVGQFAAQKSCTLQCGKYYRVKLAVQNCCTTWSETVRLIRFQCQPPLPVISGPNTTCAGLTATYTVPNVSGVSYLWSVTNGTPATATGNSVAVKWNSPSGGTITVIAVNECGCAKSTLEVRPCDSLCCPPDIRVILPPGGGFVHQGNGVYTFAPILSATGSFTRVTVTVISTSVTPLQCGGAAGPANSYVVSAAAAGGFTPALPVPDSRQVIWDSGGVGLPVSGLSLPFNIQFPPPPGFGCSDTLKFCVQYTFTDTECRTCVITKCYSFVRVGVPNRGPTPSPEDKQSSRLLHDKSGAVLKAFDLERDGETGGATIGETDALALYAGKQGGFVGLDQFNIEKPRSLFSQRWKDWVAANVVRIGVR